MIVVSRFGSWTNPFGGEISRSIWCIGKRIVIQYQRRLRHVEPLQNDVAKVGRGDGCVQCLRSALAISLVSEKEKRLVLLDRSSDRTAKLVPDRVRFNIKKWSSGRKRGTFIAIEKASVMMVSV